MPILRKGLVLLLCLLLPLSTLSGCHSDTLGEAPEMALLPLDSRPCNTKYPQLLAEAAAGSLALPPDEAMDEFLRPADRDALWQWLEEDAIDADEVIIFTNSLFCGSLIASRSSGAYDEIDASLHRLEMFCEKYDGHLTVVQVLPRLTPNQFDSVLYPYVDAITPYGRAWDEADAAGKEAPTSADGVPDDVLAEYRALHEKSAELAKALDDMAAEGMIDRLLITQDDGEAHCPANITFRALEAQHSENTELLHGADELAMLLVSAYTSTGLDATPVHLSYSSEANKDRTYPYESISLDEMTSEKLALAELVSDDNASSTLWVHCDTNDLSQTQAAITEHDGLFALADVAKTNSADPALAETLLSAEGLDQIDAYAGWNTAGNSIGTVCAMLRTMAALDARWDSLSSEAREAAATALVQFRALRLAEDVCFMAELRSTLQSQFETEGLSNYTTAFSDDAAWETANTRLAEAFAPYSERLAALFNGSHTLHLPSHDVRLTVSDFSATAHYPWSRSFEAAIDIALSVTLEE